MTIVYINHDIGAGPCYTYIASIDMYMSLIVCYVDHKVGACYILSYDWPRSRTLVESRVSLIIFISTTK